MRAQTALRASFCAGQSTLAASLLNRRLALLLNRTRHLPFCWLGEVTAIKTPCQQQRTWNKALQAMFSRHIAAHPRMPGFIPQRERSTQRGPTSATRQNNSFWMSASNRTIIVGSVPNERGYTCACPTQAHYDL